MSARLYKPVLGTTDATIYGMEVTFRDLLYFVLANKGNKTFRNCSQEDIVEQLRVALENKELYYETNLDGRISGMILAVIDHDKKLIWVQENLAMNIGTLRRFAFKSSQQFPGYALAAQRHGRDVYYDTDKLYSKLI